MCEPAEVRISDVAVPVTAGVALVALATSVIAVAVSAWPVLLGGAVATVVVTAVTVRLLARRMVVYWPSRVGAVQRAAPARVAPRALPPVARAIEAQVIVVTPDAVFLPAERQPWPR